MSGDGGWLPPAGGEPTPPHGLPPVARPPAETPYDPVLVPGPAADPEDPTDVVDDDDDEDGPASEGARRARREARRHRQRQRRRTLFILGAAVVVVIVAVIAWYEIEAHPFGQPGAQEVVTITPGESTDQVVSTLAQRGVIGSSLAFRLSFFVHGTPAMQAGRYLFHQNLPFATVHDILGAGPDVFGINVLPGYTVAELANTVDDLPGHTGAAFLAEAKSGQVTSPFEPAGTNNLEGLLGTGYYEVLPGETDEQLLQAMVARFDQTAAQAGLNDKSAAALGLTPYQVVIVASVVEKEGYIVKNMGPVARVIYNRLANGTPLQMNSTVFYSLGQDGGVFTPADRDLNSPYNSYLHAGLPPTPICFPSPTALADAANPPPGSWLYFVVVDKDGTEAFSDTYAGQVANEKLAASRGVG